MKYHLITYGCQMNVADSDEMAQPLKERGLLATADPKNADIIIMNTCTVRDQAEHRADSNIGRLRKWKDENPNRILIVAGCAASRWGDSIQKKYPFIDLVSPATQIEQFPQAVDRVLKERWNWQKEIRDSFGLVGAGGCPPVQVNDQPPPNGTNQNGIDVAGGQPAAPTDLFGSELTAYVTTMRGCNYSCSYCIVPQVRGREKYRPLPEILDEVRRRVAEGFREVMLLGQTVNSYVYRLTESRVVQFAELLREVSAIPGVDRIRFMSPHPKHMRDDVIAAMAESPNVCRHIHLPLQSGSDAMLQAMKRLYSRADYAAIVTKLRSAMPGILISTDIIVGYPGESEEDLQATLSLMSDLRFDGLFAFKFSPRPGTTAAALPDDVPADEKEARLQRVLALNDAIVEEKRAASVSR